MIGSQEQGQNPESEQQKQAQAASVKQSLFGGAFSIDMLPANFRDISDIVPISDNQEIFSDVNENNPAYSGNQLIIEILDKNEKVDNEALKLIFDDLIEEQSAQEPKVIEEKHFCELSEISTIMTKFKPLESSVSVHLLKGTAMIAPNKKKYQDQNAETPRDFVTLLMCLIRLNEPYDTDLTITLNVPDKITDEEQIVAGDGGPQAKVGESEAYKKFLEQSE